jgi:hypothetical protein
MIEWTHGWRPFAEDRRRLYFEGELRWEVAENPAHCLSNREWEAVGLFGLYDDLIVRLDGRDEFAWVHLTWSREHQPHWPHCQLLGGTVELNRFLRHWVPLPMIPDSDDERS